MPALVGVLLLLGSTADATPYSVLLESDVDRSDGTEIFLTSFGTFDDLINSPPSGGTGAFSGLNVNPAYSVGGIAYDGKYHVLLESDIDRSDGTEIFLTSFDTFDDLINSPPSGGTGAFSGLNVNPAYSVGGFAYDGKYHVLLESDIDRSDGTEIFLTSFDTFDDLINSPPSGGTGAFSGLNVNPAYSVGGFVSAFAGDDPGVSVPGPGTLLLLAAGLGILGLMRRRGEA
jgi:hypothetical protein